LRVESAELAHAQPANRSPIRQRPAGACPGRSSLDCPDAVSTAEREGLVAAAVAGRRRALFLEAFAAVDRLVVPRLEGDFSLLAAGRAHGRIHLARSGGVTTAAARGVATTTAGISAAGIATTTTAAAGVATRGATAVVAAGRALSLALRPAIGATLRLGVAALLVERLLSGRKSECLAAIAAGDRPIRQLAETSLAVSCTARNE
jgi:hypothetical protein